MIRTAYIQKQILNIFRHMDSITFPIVPENLLPLLSFPCRFLSYTEAAQVIGCTVDAIYRMCGSSSGATQYQPNANRCLIFYNNSQPDGRVLWTKAHELGHVMLGHIHMMGGRHCHYDLLEREADFFAWNLLAPMPLMREFGIQNPKQVQRVFGLSKQAADLCFQRYVRWERSHIKTAWENDLIHTYRHKQIKAGAS